MNDARYVLKISYASSVSRFSLKRKEDLDLKKTETTDSLAVVCGKQIKISGIEKLPPTQLYVGSVRIPSLSEVLDSRAHAPVNMKMLMTQAMRTMQVIPSAKRKPKKYARRQEPICQRTPPSKLTEQKLQKLLPENNFSYVPEVRRGSDGTSMQGTYMKKVDPSHQKKLDLEAALGGAAENLSVPVPAAPIAALELVAPKPELPEEYQKPVMIVTPTTARTYKNLRRGMSLEVALRIVTAEENAKDLFSELKELLLERAYRDTEVLESLGSYARKHQGAPRVSEGRILNPARAYPALVRIVRDVAKDWQEKIRSSATPCDVVFDAQRILEMLREKGIAPYEVHEAIQLAHQTGVLVVGETKKNEMGYSALSVDAFIDDFMGKRVSMDYTPEDLRKGERVKEHLELLRKKR